MSSHTPNKGHLFKKVLPAVLSLVLVLGQARGLCAADVYLSLSSQANRTAIGIGGFYPLTPTVDESNIGRQVQSVVTDDLLFSRYFNLAEGGQSYTGKEDDIRSWSSLGVNIVLAGSVKIDGQKIILTARLFDTGSAQPVFEKDFVAEVAAYRYLAHSVSDEIIRRITGENGIAHTRIVFSNDKTGSKELYVVDYDGYNLKRITNDNSIDILPRWSNGSDEVLFTTYRFGNPDLYAVSPVTGRRRAISIEQGLNAAACFSPDGEKIVLTRSRGSYPNLFLIDKTGALLRQLTSGANIETSASFAPNGKEIVFVTDSPGYPQMEIMDIEGGNIRMIFTEGVVDSPAWSPRGDKIAFSMRHGRQDYDIYIYDLSTAKNTRLTQNEGSNENPSWSPDGRFVVFSSRRSSKRELFVMALDGSGLRKIVTMQGSSSTPSWSH